MSLRFKLAAIASAMALSVGAAVAFAEPAFAKDNQLMGVTDAAGGTQWAYTDSAAAGQEVNMANTDGPSPWDVSGSTSGTHQISYYDSGSPGLCMTIDTTNDRVRLEKCAAAGDQEWETLTGISGGNGHNYNEYYNPLTGDCLNDHYQVNQLNVATCNSGKDQLWFPNGVNPA
jgi:hypothetical protein